MKNKKLVFTDSKLKSFDIKFSEIHAGSLNSVASPKTLEELLAHTTFQMKEVLRGMDFYLSNGKVNNKNYQFVKSLCTLYRAETYLDVVASNKILVQPRIQGLDINVYYKYNEGRNIYEFAKAMICNPMAIQELAHEELDVTDSILSIMNIFANSPEIRTLPNYINYPLFETNGCALDVIGVAPPSMLSISVCLTIPALEILKDDSDMEALIRGWVNDPTHMVKNSMPKLSFVTSDIRAKTGYLAPDFEVPKNINTCTTYFQLNKKSLLSCLNEAGFETGILFTCGNEQSLVRGTVMGANHLCIDNYIAPALESIKATKHRIRALKTDKARERFIKHTNDKMEDQINILNYLRTFKYFVTGLFVEPNYLIIRRRVSNALEQGMDRLYVEPSIVSKLNDSSVLEVIATMGLQVADAVSVVEYTGYEGYRNVFSKKVVRDIKRDLGVDLSETQISRFRDNFERIKENRSTNSVPNLIMMKEKLWNM